MKRLTLLSICSLVLVHSVSAQTLIGLTEDARVRSNPATDPNPATAFISSTTSETSQAGFGGSPTAFNSAVLVFQLPTLGVGETFASAQLNFSAFKNSTPAFDADLYGLDRRASATVLGTDFFAGANDTRTFATLLQSSILTPSLGTSMTFLSTNTTGNTNLTTFLNTQYAGGAGAGQYVFLRFNIDTAIHENTINRYEVATADNATASLRPSIDYISIPEPSTFVLLSVAFGTVLLLRKRRA
ncbi:MAG: PEP-CTERM sorting domain-containing protein [Candidatus Competibacteraceae bacterium]|nr:PEP-CTERM sorting domain-containing protein [Candidatus Competibacteraceae bacterium]